MGLISRLLPSAFIAGGLCAQSVSVLNMSHDLVANGIAAQNLQPNNPLLDARPLFEKAVAYATANAISTITADRGNYYFLSLHSAAANAEHVLLNGAANVTIDWQYSDLYFAFSNRAAIDCTNCSSLTLQNFTVDFTQLPFTQVTVTAVDTVHQTISFQLIPGYQSPEDFNAGRAADGSDVFYMFVFHNGSPLRIGRMIAGQPVNGNVLQIAGPNDASIQPAYLATIQAGDTLVFEDRSGPPAIDFVNGQNATVRNVSIYSSGQIGLYFGRTNVATADHVQVIPRPGTDRLISSNADGIHTSFARGAQTFANNIVRRTCDDAYAIAATWIATVSKASSGSAVVVSNTGGAPYPVGAQVSFISTVDSTVVGTASITAEDPPASQQTMTAGESVTLTLSQPIPGIAAGFGMVDADPAKRGSGSVIRNNLFQQGVFSRGIWLSGVENVNVHDNLIQQTSNVGIFVQEQTGTLAPSSPSSGISISNNLVDNTINYGGVSTGPIVNAAAIHVVSEASNNGQVPSSPNANINVTGNRVTNSPRTAIRLENVNGGQITNNTIQGYAQAPFAFVYIIPPCCETSAQYQADFMQPVLTTNSTSITTTPNSVAADTAGLIASASTASYSPKVAVDSLTFSYAPNLVPSVTTTISASQLPLSTSLNGVTVQITDSAGVAQLAPILAVSPTLVDYQIPDGTAPGIATVTIGAFSGVLLIDTVAPSLYSANASSQGVAAANAYFYSADGTTTLEPVFQCASGVGSCQPVPLNLGGPSDKLLLVLYGTGLRNFSSTQNVVATIGGMPASIQFIGAQPTYAGLGEDQVNLWVPPGLAGAGEVPVLLTVDGQTANAVTISLN